MGNIMTDVGNALGMGKNGILSNAEQAVKPALQDAEQALSGGKGWGGLAKNIGGVIAAPATMGASLLGTQAAENAMNGTGAFGNQQPLINEPANASPSTADTTGNAQISFHGAPTPTTPQKDLLGQIGDVLGGVGKVAGDVAGNKDVQNLAGNYLGSQAQADVARRAQDMQKQAYDEMMARSKEGEGQFLNANTQTNPALSAYATDLQNLSSQNIGRNQNTINQQLARSGVQGGQAANLYGRQIGSLQQSGQRDINQLAYQDAAAKNTAQQQYFANKGQSGFNLVPKYS